MKKITKKHLMIRHLDGIFGIGVIGAMKIAARVVDPRRFKYKGKWLSYCGLMRQEKLSGGRSYGWKTPRYCRSLKGVFKTAALSIINRTSQNPFKDYYEFLLKEKCYAEHHARHALARRIAVVALGVMKSGKPYHPQRIAAVIRN